MTTTHILPGIGDQIGSATIVDMRLTTAGDVVAMGLWDEGPQRFATWVCDADHGLIDPHYFSIRDAAEKDFAERG